MLIKVYQISRAKIKAFCSSCKGGKKLTQGRRCNTCKGAGWVWKSSS